MQSNYGTACASTSRCLEEKPTLDEVRLVEVLDRGLVLSLSHENSERLKFNRLLRSAKRFKDPSVDAVEPLFIDPKPLKRFLDDIEGEPNTTAVSAR